MALVSLAANWAFSAEAAEHNTAQQKFDAQAIEFFESQVRPLLVKRCFECHGPKAKRLEGGLLMVGRQSLIDGGDNGPAIAPGNAKQSLLIDAIHYGGDLEMPPTGKLPVEEITLLTKWVDMGAPWPKEASNAPDPRAKFDLPARKRSHWAWQPIADPQPPAVKQKDWPLDPLDNFILARLEAEGLQPAGPADARTLLRRLYFDLIGLPPTEEQSAKFLKACGIDPAQSTPGQAASRIPQSAIESVVDELLASPQFGERWGRHWLDLMRYAESRGHEFDYNSPNAWEYRDYVIRALNADVPYDQFVTEHIAGDLLKRPRRNPELGYNESIIATGFWHLGEWVHSPVDTRKDECDRQDNQLDTFGKAFLGMTIACARCHDHKFDAISQRDYYALAGYVQSSAYRLARFETLDHNRDVAQKLHDLRLEAGGELAQLHAEARQPVLDKLEDYLLAAREAIVAGAAGEQLAAIAQERQLNAAALSAWIEQLKSAKDHADDPLHLWARLAHEKNLDGERVAEFAGSIVDAIARRAQGPQDALAAAEVIIDFGAVGDRPWMTDGSAFGVAPTQIGQPLMTGDAQQPLAGFAIYGAARRDKAFRDLKFAPGAMNDQGKLAGWQRAGQSIGTPTFTVADGPVYYLVQGAGRAFAVVDSHRLVQGPLHGEVLMQWNDDGQGRPRWVTQNLSRHRGHRIHVEFSPNGGGDLEVLMVAQGPHPPGLPFDATGAALLADRFGKEDAASLKAIAAAYKRLLSDTNSASAEGIPGRKDARDVAALANWMQQHPALWTADDEELQKQLAAAGEHFAAAERQLTGQIKTTSRLAMAMWDGYPEDEQFLIRGNHGSVDGTVPRHILTALGGAEGDCAELQFGSGRLELARQLVDPSNPLTARVMVNRIWHHVTGRGIVPTTDNFGVLGLPPTHPELLDHLATRFMREGWSVKRMIKTIVLSRTYQMSSYPTEMGEQRDPSNKWLHRMRIRRLEGEAIRDAMLVVSGRLDKKMYGRPVPVYLTPFMTGRGRPGGGPLDGAGRRSVYTSVRRNFLSPMMLAFDLPQPSTAIGRRTVSNVPAQALIMMNDPLVIQQAEMWAKRLLADKELSPEKRIAKMYLQAFARPPSDDEASAAVAFLSEQAVLYGIPDNQATTSVQTWSDLCHVMFNVKEFLFIN